MGLFENDISKDTESNVMASAMDTSAPNGDTVVENRQFPRKSKKNFKRSQHHFISRDRRRSLPGRRPARRRENLQFLLSLVDGIEIVDNGQVDFCDLMEKTTTAFTELFLEEEKMTAWHEFANSSEEEQREIIKSASVPPTQKKNWLSLHLTSDFVDATEPDLVEQSRFAFARINCKLRHFLSRKHIPKGDLLKIEEELVDFFMEWPDLVYITCLPTSFHRMLIHAVSQYLDLESKSFNCAPGTRKTQVESKSNRFSHPGITLVEYIDLIKS